MIGKAIKYMRKKSNFKQEEIAKTLNVKNNTVSQYETGSREPTFAVIEKIARKCGYAIYFVNNKNNDIFTINDLKRKDI